MKRLCLIGLALAFCANAALALDAVPGFMTSSTKAVKLAKKENKPLYLHFTTDWCGWCRKIENDIYKNPEGKKSLEPFVAASLDCTKGAKNSVENQQLFKKLGGSGYPFLVMITPDGEVLNTIGGYVPMKQFQAELGKALSNWKKIEELENTKDKTTYEYNLKALTLYSEMSSWDKAAQAAAVLQKLDPKGDKGHTGEIVFALLHAERAKKQPNEKVITQLENQLIQADPQNEKGYLQAVYMARADKAYEQAVKANKEKQPKKVNENLTQIADTLKELIQKAKTLEQPNIVYMRLGFAQAQLTEYDAAIGSMEKAISLTSDKRMKAQLEEFLAGIRKEKAKAVK